MKGESREMKREWPTLVLWNTVWLACGLILLELAFGEWLLGDGMPFYVARNIVVPFDCSSLYDSCGKVDYSRDRWGLRGGDADVSKIEILTVGGSTTDQRYLPLRGTWQAVLAEELERRRGRPVVVANAGMDGLSTVGHLHSLEHWYPRIPGLRPRLVVYLVGVNDIEIPAEQPEDPMMFNPFRRNLEDKSAMLRLARIIRGLVRARLRGLPFDGHERAEFSDLAQEKDLDLKVRQFSDQARGRLDAYQLRLLRIAELTRHRLGAHPVFVTQVSAALRQGNPPMVSRSLADHAIAHAAFNKATLAACVAAKAICADLEGEVAFEATDFYDDIHATPSGARKTGLFIARKIPPE
jgi:hypothetical protein